MPANTPIAALPYPLLADVADIETAVKPLALALDGVVLTADQKAALAGTSGTPNASNKYVTYQDALTLIPIGAILPYAGSALPAGGQWDWADGGLIAAATYPAFAGVVGHAYNGGVDPGAGMVRKPDKRGRASVGADSFGAAGPAGRLTGPKIRGAGAGVEKVALDITQVPSHGHTNTFAVANAGAIAVGAVQPWTTGWNAPIADTYWGYGTRPSGAGQIDGYVGPGGSVSYSGGAHAHTLPAHGHGLSGAVQPTGGGLSHDNMGPYEVDLYIVRVA